jgi:UDP-glucuronate 4-epimerase
VSGGGIVQGEKIVVTGATGSLALPLVRELSRDNEVWALARFRDAGMREALEDLGVTCVVKDLAADTFDDLPDDFTRVYHAAGLVFTEGSENDFSYTFEINVQATARLMHHFRYVRTFVYCSTGAVYAHQGRPVAESDPYGVSIPAYSLSKIAAENVVIFIANQWQVPTVILRIGMVWGPEGDRGPGIRVARMLRGEEVLVSPVTPAPISLIWEDDSAELSVKALTLGAVPPLIVNLGGDEPVSTEEVCTYAGELLGIEPKFRYTDEAYTPMFMDPTFRQQVLGPCKVGWREGMRRMLGRQYPDLVAAAHPDGTP